MQHVLSPAAHAAIKELADAQALAYQVQPGAVFSLSRGDQEQIVSERIKANPLLDRINRVIVKHPSAKKIFGKITGTIHGRGTRSPKEKIADSVSRYEVKERDFDYVIPYGLLDTWFSAAGGSQEVFAGMIKEWYAKKMSDEMAAIALRGTSQAANPQGEGTDEAKLQAVDLGFEQLMRDATYGKPANVLDNMGDGGSVIIVGPKRELSGAGAVVANLGGVPNEVQIPLPGHGFIAGGMVRIRFSVNYNGEFLLKAGTDANNLVIESAYTVETFGATVLISQVGHFETLDQAVSDAMADLLPEDIAFEGDLEVMLSRDVAAEAEAKLMATIDGSNPLVSNKSYIAQMLSSFGGLVSNRVMGMKARQVMITAWKNLSYYELDGSRRVKFEDNPKEGGLVQWTYYAACQAVEDVDACIILNNVYFLRKHEDQA
ncbi:MAG: hypothetical protein A2527_14180 [Candidatus Lambdaproteobacteria bacterium RIFOXYD2_FULL_50_16]|uniref:Phage major capsid protein n=1 Tax=Candidatus Lambdaproteobacteria bacterium RIFOXYD2_FULL_50_16 TaxID=1817772 RepID=A0A1F6G4S5_9PROT|nr:MAG: hypothetical protein A2527_14180 [Candidatus Lambdaproteobacteria bacterium RIFOXYD2_FULL_50_16]